MVAGKYCWAGSGFGPRRGGRTAHGRRRRRGGPPRPSALTGSCRAAANRPDGDAASGRRRGGRSPARRCSSPPGSTRRASSPSNPAPRSKACRVDRSCAIAAAARCSSLRRPRMCGSPASCSMASQAAWGRRRAAYRDRVQASRSLRLPLHRQRRGWRGAAQSVGRISDCEIGDIRKAGLFSEDAAGLEIAHNHVHDCGDNGILVWRSEPGEDAPS